MQRKKIVHVKALCEMVEALTEDTRFTELAEELLKEQKEGKEIIMCDYLDMLEAKGESRLASLIQVLLREKKYSEIEAVAENREKRQELYRQYSI